MDARPLPDAPQSSTRRASIDILRGLAIVGMIAANVGMAVDLAFPGGKTYPTLLHARWLGCTMADLVFPLFLFVVGLSMAFSIPRPFGRPIPWARTLRRGAWLVGLGLAVNAYNALLSGDPVISPNGTLQRIGIVYVFAIPIYFRLEVRGRLVVAVGSLLAYWAALELLPFPGVGPGDLMIPNRNFSAWLDLQIFGETIMRPGPDGIPQLHQGLLGYLPSVAYPLVGSVVGDWLREGTPTIRRAIGMAIGGIAVIGIGAAWGIFHPICRPLWSSSFIVYSLGVSLVATGAVVALVDVGGIRGRVVRFVEILGQNALAAYLIHVLAITLVTISMRGVYVAAQAKVSAAFASLFVIGVALAIVYTAVFFLDRRGIYWRV